MDKPVDVSQFVQGLFPEARFQKILICCESIPLVLQAVIGNDTHPAIQLGFTKDEGENGNAEVLAGHGEERGSGVLGPGKFGELSVKVGDDRGGIVLQPQLIVKKRQVDIGFPHDRRSPQPLADRRAESGHQSAICVAERKQNDRIHGVRFRPYFSILW